MSATPSRREVDKTAILLMIFLCMIWGLQQTAIKAISADMAPVLQMGIRSALAALAVGLIIIWQKDYPAFRKIPIFATLSVGIFFALEFLLTSEGLCFTSAAHMSIFLYTAPIFAALGLHVGLPEERLSPIQWGGIALAFLGVVVAFMGPGSGMNDPALRYGWVGDILGVLAGASWGMTTLIIRFSNLSEAPATVTLFCQLTVASIILIPTAFLSHQTVFHPTTMVILDFIFQLVIVSIISFLIWFSLLRVYLASRLGALSLMTPLFGILFGAVLLHETLRPEFLFGSALILSGISLVSKQAIFKRKEH
ncbi:DMT family transporter [Acetobacter aceti]|uniref:Membrane protein n=1 Tax=Acetobacter aceti TaxID=435 RepID=A0A6S6PTR6_ACEAC|nr:DMT family transporter [Acetobacter aceti]BCI68464.1 membrane protein [Acetobacter aceti]